MLNDFWILIVEVWQTGISGISINEIVVCILIVLCSLLLRSFINLKVINWVARFAKNTQSTLKEDLIALYKKIIESFKNKKTLEFIKLYFGNNAINTVELCKILPIYDI